MVQEAVIVVKPEQQRTDDAFLFSIAESADDAVSGALLLDLDHRPLSRTIFLVRTLGDHSVERSAAAPQPGERHLSVASHRRELKARRDILAEELFQFFAPLRERQGRQRLLLNLQQVE